MSIRVKATSGTYNVLETELAVNDRRTAQHATLQCVVHLLDDSQQTFSFDVCLPASMPQCLALRSALLPYSSPYLHSRYFTLYIFHTLHTFYVPARSYYLYKP